MRLSTVEQPVRKKRISAANPKQSLRNIDNYIRSTDSRGKLAACNSQPKPREFVLPLKRMSHLFSNSTDLKAVAVFRAHTRHRQRFGPRSDVARIAPAIRRDVSTRPSPPTHVLRLYVENISFTVTVSISSNNFGAVRFAPPTPFRRTSGDCFVPFGGRSHLKPQWQRICASIRRRRSAWKVRLQPRS
jgi:hypothetical protein